LIFGAAFAGVASAVSAAPVTLLATGFESTGSPAYALNHTLKNYNSWTESGSGTATISNIAPETGSQDLLMTPYSAGTASFFYQNLTTPAATATAAGDTLITSLASVAITAPASGTVTSGIVAGIQEYNANLATDPAYMVIEYDPNYATDGDGLTAAWDLEAAYNTSSGFYGFDYTFPNIANTFAAGENLYFDLGIVDDTVNDVFTFTLGGTELFDSATDGGPTPGTLASTYGTALLYDFRVTTTGTTGRALVDNYSVVASAPIPEPTAAMAVLPLAAAATLRRRRHVPVLILRN
jgi:hypothetical protein